MTTSLRNAWITPKLPTTERVYVTIRENGRRGIVWDGTPLVEQMARDAIVVCFDDGRPATYYSRKEIEFQEK